MFVFPCEYQARNLPIYQGHLNWTIFSSQNRTLNHSYDFKPTVHKCLYTVLCQLWWAMHFVIRSNLLIYKPSIYCVFWYWNSHFSRNWPCKQVLDETNLKISALPFSCFLWSPKAWFFFQYCHFLIEFVIYQPCCVQFFLQYLQLSIHKLFKW